MFCTRCGKQIADKAVICIHCCAPVVTFTKEGKAQTVDILRLNPYNNK